MNIVCLDINYDRDDDFVPIRAMDKIAWKMCVIGKGSRKRKKFIH